MQNAKTDLIPHITIPKFISDYLGWAMKQGGVENSTSLIPAFVYRGHSKATWVLLPSLCRDRSTLDLKLLKQDEQDVIAEFRHRFDLAGWLDADVMAYARHHGAPTRLLDWSSNPFVALWFAVSDTNEEIQDGVVYQLNPWKKQKLVTVVSEPLQNLKAGEDFHCDGGCPIHVFSSPPRVDRTDRQNSFFTLANFSGNYVKTPLDQVLAGEPNLLRKFSVPAERKKELRRMLMVLGLDAYSIYGGPDALGKAMSARLYKP